MRALRIVTYTVNHYMIINFVTLCAQGPLNYNFVRRIRQRQWFIYERLTENSNFCCTLYPSERPEHPLAMPLVKSVWHAGQAN